MIDVFKPDEIQRRLLREVADLYSVPKGAYNLRVNSQLAARNNSANIEIVSKGDGTDIYNCGAQDSQHDGVHRFFVEKNARVRYVEKHYGSGAGTGKRILNPVTEAFLDENSSMEMDMVQIKGVDSTERRTKAELKSNAHLLVWERLIRDSAVKHHGAGKEILPRIVGTRSMSGMCERLKGDD